MKPNIFNIAIKEFHQDAFITWLLQWSDPNNKELDEQLFLCGQEFIKSLISTQYKGTISNFIKVEAGRQWENIDIWAEVYTQNENYLIIIEDKTFTSEHSDKLTKYKKIGEDYCKGKKFNLVCIYLKTGDEPERILNSIQKKGFTIFNRKDFIHLLDKYKKIKNLLH